MKPLKELLSYTFENFCQIKTAFMYSSVYSLAGTITLSMTEVVNVWIQGNIDYLMVAFGSVGVAQVLGTIVHSSMYKNDFDWKKNIIGFCIMMSMVIAVGLLMEGLAHLTKEENFIYMYLRMVGRVMVIIYPVRSAFRNVKIITNGAFPPDAIIGKLENFNKNLDLNEFRDKNPSEINNQNEENHE